MQPDVIILAYVVFGMPFRIRNHMHFFCFRCVYYVGAFLLRTLRGLCWSSLTFHTAFVGMLLLWQNHDSAGEYLAFLFRILSHRVYVVCTPTLLFRFMSCLVWLFEYATMCISFAYVAWIVLMHFFCVHCLDNVDAHSHSIWPLWEFFHCDKIMI